MPTGKIIKLVHLSQQTHQPTSQLVPSHNDKGYGTIRDEDGRDVHFSHDAVPGRHGFDDLHHGQSVEFTLDSDPPSRAKIVRVAAASADGRGPTESDADEFRIHFRHVVRTFQRPFQTPWIADHPLDGYPGGK